MLKITLKKANTHREQQLQCAHIISIWCSTFYKTYKLIEKCRLISNFCSAIQNRSRISQAIYSMRLFNGKLRLKNNKKKMKIKNLRLNKLKTNKKPLISIILIISHK